MNEESVAKRLERLMQVHLLIFKVQREFAEESQISFIAAVHSDTAPTWKWASSTSLPDLSGRLEKYVGIDWNAVKTAVLKKGGFQGTFELTDRRFNSIFGRVQKR